MERIMDSMDHTLLINIFYRVGIFLDDTDGVPIMYPGLSSVLLILSYSFNVYKGNLSDS
jgi:hypothetical protein